VANSLSFSSRLKKDNEMPIDTFQSVLTLCKDDLMNGICISGGEPFLHSRFPQLLSAIRDNLQLKDVCFSTSGLMLKSYLSEIIALAKHKDFLRICLYYRDTEFSHELLDTINSLQENNIKIEIATEVLDTDNQNFDPIINFAEKTRLNTLRWEITIPKKKVNPSKFYLSVKSNLVSLLKSCAENKIIPYTTCNHIPYCYFSSEDLRLLTYISNDNFGGLQCNNIICFHPDNSVSGCTVNFENQNCLKSNFVNLSDIKDILNNKAQVVQKNYVIEACNSCQFKNLIFEKCGCFFE
jgi:organic radical activating enzyme